MKHILKESRQGAYILVDKVLPSSASAGGIVEIHRIDGSVTHKVLISGWCTDCSQYEADASVSDGCFTTKHEGDFVCPAVHTNLVFKGLDNIMENL